MLLLLLIPCAIALAYCVLVTVRNGKVRDERLGIIDELYRLNCDDITHSRPYEWRRRYFHNGPSYDEMLFKFWRPVNSFFPPVWQWKPPEQ
jgi:hypothetical protein